MISEKDGQIVAAVNDSRGELSGRANRGDNVLKCLSRASIRYDKGSYESGSRRATNEYWEVICTIEEYNQCIEDMARAEWVSGGSMTWDYDYHKGKCKLSGIETSNTTLLAKHCDYSFYDEPLVYTQGNYEHGLPIVGQACNIKYRGGNAFNNALIMYISEYGFVHKDIETGVEIFCGSNDVVEFLPIKTPEQIKQDKLDAQVDKMSNMLTMKGFGHDQILLKCLQSHDYIVEPK